MNTAIVYCKQHVTEGEKVEIDQAKLDVIIAKQKTMNQIIKFNRLDNIANAKPIIWGKDIFAAMDIKPGHIMKHINVEVINFQILNSDATKEEAGAYLKENKDVFIEKYPPY